MARIAIDGSVTLASTCRILVDVTNEGPVPGESVSFLTGGQVLAGHLEITVTYFPDPGDQFRVISMNGGTGKMDSITGWLPFTDVIEDALGVLILRT